MKDTRKYFLGWTLAFLVVFTIIPPAESASAEIKTFVDEYSYRASKIDDRASSRMVARRQVRRLLLEALGAYLEKEAQKEESPLRKEQIVTLAAGAVGTDMTEEKWDGLTFWFQAKIVADADAVLRTVDALGKDPEKMKELEKIRRRSDGLLRESERLRKEWTAVAGKKRQTVKAAYEETIKELTAVDWYEKGYAAVTHGRSEEAVEDFGGAIASNPKDAGAYYYRGLAHAGLRRHAQAIQDFGRAIELNPDLIVAYIGRGFASFQLGQHDRAIQDFDRAIERNPKLAIAYNGRAIVNANRGKIDDALSDYDRAIALSPRFTAAYINRGLAAYNLGRYERALPDFDRVIEQDPKMTVAYVYRGLAQYNLGRFDQAIQDYGRALELDPKLVMAYYNRSRIYSLRDQPEKAIQDLQTAIHLNPALEVSARKENDFSRIRQQPEFIKLVGP